MEGLVKNTLCFKFPDGANGPSVVEMARFAKTFDADKFTMESVYKISEERCLCIKFMNERMMKDALMQNQENHVFEYSNGEKVQVTMSVAGGCTKYIRIFDLPPEVPDQEISTVLSKYGVVRRMVREKFPPQLELDLTTGVRGVHIEIKKEIPATLFFLNRRGRVYYEGVKHKCFLCKEEGHLKAECPKNPVNQEKSKPSGSVGEAAGSSIGTTKDPRATSGQNSYAAMLKNKAPVSKAAECNMTVLAPKATVTSNNVVEVSGPEPAAVKEDVNQAPADESVGAVGGEPASDSESLPGLEMEVDESGQAVKRQHDTTSTDDEGFSRVTRSRKQMKDDDPLEIIATVPVRSKNGGRSKSKH